MFETVLGIPAHPLLVHAVVVLMPVLVVVALGYALLPRFRTRLDWAVVLLALAVPPSAWLAKQSGEALRARLVRQHTISAQDLVKVGVHQSYAGTTFRLAVVLGILALLLVGYQLLRARRAEFTGTWPAVLWWVLVAATAVISAVGLYYIFKTGDTGAHVVWQGR